LVGICCRLNYEGMPKSQKRSVGIIEAEDTKNPRGNKEERP
jgi:hypothetical protein